MTARRVVVTSAVLSLLTAGAAYGVGLAVAHSSPSAGPELGPRIVRPAVAEQTPTPSAPAVPVETPTTSPSPTITPTETATPPPEPVLPTVVLRPGDKGEQVRELQSRLYQLAWLPEEIGRASCRERVL